MGIVSLRLLESLLKRAKGNRIKRREREEEKDGSALEQHVFWVRVGNMQLHYYAGIVRTEQATVRSASHPGLFSYGSHLIQWEVIVLSITSIMHSIIHTVPFHNNNN